MLRVWAPVTAYAALLQWRSRAAWAAGVSFTVSVFVLLVVARVFQESYILYPLSGVMLSMLLALEPAGWARCAPSSDPAAARLPPAPAPEPVALPVGHALAGQHARPRLWPERSRGRCHGRRTPITDGDGRSLSQTPPVTGAGTFSRSVSPASVNAGG